MHKLTFKLNISREKYLNWYSGKARQVVTVADSGQKITFPADRLRPFVSHEGVNGHFAISFDDNHKFVSLELLPQ